MKLKSFLFSLLILLSILGTGCLKKKNITPKSTLYVKVKIEGEKYKMKEHLIKFHNDHNEQSSGTEYQVASTFYTLFAWEEAALEEICLKFVFSADTGMTNNEVVEMIETGSYGFTEVGSFEPRPAAFVSVLLNNREYTTARGSQEGSSFEVLDVEQGDPKELFPGHRKVLMKFNCTLYDDLGNAVRLEDGYAVMNYGDFF